jgi:hypothetical protein
VPLTQPAVEAFFAASRDGDFEALVAMRDPAVEVRIDGGVLREDASLVLHGAARVARHTERRRGTVITPDQGRHVPQAGRRRLEMG